MSEVRLRKIKITGYVLLMDDEIPGDSPAEVVANRISDFIYNEDYSREWIIEGEEVDVDEW